MSKRKNPLGIIRITRNDYWNVRMHFLGGLSLAFLGFAFQFPSPYPKTGNCCLANALMIIIGVVIMGVSWMDPAWKQR